VAPAGNDGSASCNVLLTVDFERIGSMDGVTGGFAGSEAGGVHAGSMDGGGISLFVAAGSQVGGDGLVGGGAAG